jgi:D-glycero-alpha-D-manno-heptose 1-phosphate guanylyltransferase
MRKITKKACRAFRNRDSFKLNNSFSFEKEYLNKPAALNAFDVFVTKGVFIDIGVPEDYFLAQSFLLDYQ